MSSSKVTGLESGAVDRKSDEAKGRFLGGVTKGVDLEKRTVEGIASTIHVDRDREIILPRAFKAKLAQFKGGHRPMLAQHTHRTGDGGPSQIGWVEEITIEREQIPCVFRFAKTTLGEEWWKLASDPDGHGIAFSIGFIPLKWVRGSVAEIAKKYPELRDVLAEADFNDDDRILVYTEIELMEISGVGVPSNRESIQQLAAKFYGMPEDKGDEARAKLLDEIAAKVTEQVELALIEAVDEIKGHTSLKSDEIQALLPDPLNAGVVADDPAGDDETRNSAGSGEPDKTGSADLQAAARGLQAKLRT